MSNPPPSNLNPDAQPWGRYVTSLAEQTRQQADLARADIENAGRLSNSTLDVLADQITEVQSRPIASYMYPTDTSPAFNAASGTVNVTVTDVLIPEPDRPRWGWVLFRVFLRQSAPAENTTANVLVSVNGEIVQTTTVRLPSSPTLPASWGDDMRICAFGAFTAAPGEPAIIHTEVSLTAVGANMRTVWVDKTAMVQYAQPVGLE